MMGRTDRVKRSTRRSLDRRSAGRLPSGHGTAIPQCRRPCMPARLALVFSVFVLLIAPIDAGAAEKVTVALDFTLSGSHAPWFVANDEGYFAGEGLDVTLGRGYGSGDTVKKLATGAIDIGLNHPAPLIIANAEGGTLRAVMGYLNQEMCAMYSSAEGGNVRVPKDLA